MRPDELGDLSSLGSYPEDITVPVPEPTADEPPLDDLSRQAQQALDAYVVNYENDLLDLALRRARRVGDDLVSAVHVHEAARLLGDGGARTRSWASQASCIVLGGGVGGIVAVTQMDKPPVLLILLTFLLLIIGGVGFGLTLDRRPT